MVTAKNLVSILMGSVFSLSAFASAPESEPTLKIGEKTFKTSELLKRPDVESLKLKNVWGYPGMTLDFKAIKAAHLFKGANIQDDDVIQFRCEDGFNNVISKERILADDKNHSTAYIAIEDPKAKWPDLPFKVHKGTAGPFYLVWVKPELSQIVENEWPFKMVALEVKGKFQSLYPAIFPSKMNEKVKNGFKRFQQNCFACHKVNGEGAGEIGPDLNIPMNPTEYFQEAALRKYIRDPKSVRSWSNSQMPASGPEVFSDKDIEDIVEYLKAISKEKVAKK